MASTAIKSSSLPCKKRKASNASSCGSGGNNSSSAVSSTQKITTTTTRSNDNQISKNNDDNSNNNSNDNNSTTNNNIKNEGANTQKVIVTNSSNTSDNNGNDNNDDDSNNKNINNNNTSTDNTNSTATNNANDSNINNKAPLLQKEHEQQQPSSSRPTTTTHISESRLPSKKRKESLEKEQRIRSESIISSTNSYNNQNRNRIESYDFTNLLRASVTSSRKSSNDDSFGNDNDGILASLGNPPLPIIESTSTAIPKSNAEGQQEETKLTNDTTTTASSAALDHLNALTASNTTATTTNNNYDESSNNIKTTIASKPTTNTSGNAVVKFDNDNHNFKDDSSQDTFASSGHRLLMEAIMMNEKNSQGSNTNNSTNNQNNKNATTTTTTAATTRPRSSSQHSATNRERLDSFGRERLDSIFGRERLDSFIANRDRLESWGGMSDLSYPVFGTNDSTVAAAVAAATTNLHHGNLMEDPDHHNHHRLRTYSVDGMLNLHDNDDHDDDDEHDDSHDDDDDNDQKPSAVPNRISLNQQRDRFNSITSIGDASVSNFVMQVDGIDMSHDMNAFVAATMACMGDQLEEIVGMVENAAAVAAAAATHNFTDDTSFAVVDFTDKNSTASATGSKKNSKAATGTNDDHLSVSFQLPPLPPVFGAKSDNCSTTTASTTTTGTKRPRSWSNASGTGRISLIDLDAVQAAVDAAEAASGSLGLSSSNKTPTTTNKTSLATTKNTKNKRGRPRLTKRNLPLRNRTESNATTDSATKATKSVNLLLPPDHKPPLKKRVKRESSSPDAESKLLSPSVMPTPKISNKQQQSHQEEEENETTAPEMVTSTIGNSKSSSSKQSGQANQKWEMMYSALQEFAAERRQEETKDLTEEELKTWVWDGNVPTNYKTSDGKALGRWVNNQRSAKSKGTLKEEREERLIAAGLKWSVVASNSWNEMFQELKIYVNEQTKEGKKWDGNVPTNYQIKSRPEGEFNGEDKNLGRWVNRQRHMYQTGKLRKDRQEILEKMGLKWSMLATTSWDAMFETLEEYVDEQKKQHGVWDGNVPAHYRTNDTPSRALGRWINRQRSAYMKKKLKKEYVDKLSAIGLKWSIHQRQGDFAMNTNNNNQVDAESTNTASSTKINNVTPPSNGATANGAAQSGETSKETTTTSGESITAQQGNSKPPTTSKPEEVVSSKNVDSNGQSKSETISSLPENQLSSAKEVTAI